jgi:hypothetical protein
MCSWLKFTIVVIGTNCIGRCKSNYHTITTIDMHYFILKVNYITDSNNKGTSRKTDNLYQLICHVMFCMLLVKKQIRAKMTIIECQLVGHVDWCSVRHWSILISMVWKTMELCIISLRNETQLCILTVSSAFSILLYNKLYLKLERIKQL